MAGDKFVVAAQLSTSHSAPGTLTADAVQKKLHEAADSLDFDILITGWREAPDLFQTVISNAHRSQQQAFFWYPLLSELSYGEPRELIVNFRGAPSRGWRGFSDGGEIQETFQFSCPNNPRVRDKTLRVLESILTRYDFDGAFVDKVRFPSPANGIEEMLSCFCDWCRAKIAQQGLDLDEVRNTIESHIEQCNRRANTEAPSTAWWTDLLSGSAVLERFARFRADSITELVADVRRLTDRLGKSLGLDLFSPVLAFAVGQDYRSLARYAKWIKPMVYRFATGPAGLRYELPRLGRDMARLISSDTDQVLEFARARIPGWGEKDFNQVEREGIPLSLAEAELRQAVQLAGSTPIYMGLETVSMPGVINITPAHVRNTLEVGLAAGVHGAVLSWDVMHTPLENLPAVAQVIKR
jgi:hypothetical protein